MATIALATLIVSLFAWLHLDLTALRKEMRSEIAALRGELAGLRDDFSLLGKEVATLRERIAHTTGFLEGFRAG